MRAQRHYEQQQYNDAESVLRQVLNSDPKSRQALELITVVYLKSSRPELALQALMGLNQAYPDVALYCDRLANMLEGRGELAAAINCYRTLLTHQPDSADSHYNLARLLNRAGKPDEALQEYQSALDLGISQAEDVYSNISVILSDRNRHQEAEAALRKALSLNPQYVPALFNLAVIREELGQWSEASELFLKILELEPDHLDALTHLAHGQSFDDAEHDLVDKLVAALSENNRSLMDKESLHFAIGKVFDDCKLYDQAFENYQQGNDFSRKRAGPYDPNAQETLIQSLKDMNSTTWLRDMEPVSDEAPIFICGMFRSGSTLLEQMLAAHPEVIAGGELNYFNRELPLPASLTVLEQARLRQVGSDYMLYLKDLFPGTAQVTNKRPDNFIYLGLIQALFPKARFINTCRHPLDNCLSIYFQQFAGSVKYHAKLMDIGHYYAQYRDLMDFWKQRIPDNVIDIDYQAVVSSPRDTLQSLLEFLDLPWDEACLEFYKSDNRVRTASVWQVRQPLYQQSKGRWHNYSQHLQELEQYLETSGISL